MQKKVYKKTYITLNDEERQRVKEIFEELDWIIEEFDVYSNEVVYLIDDSDGITELTKRDLDIITQCADILEKKIW